MLSRLVSAREQSSRVVGSAFETHGPLAARGVMALLAEGLSPDEVLPDVERLIALLHRNLARAAKGMVDSDLAHSRELGDDAPVRDARDQARSSVLSVVTSIRMSLTSRFGQDFGGRLGAFGPAPEAPADVLSWGRKIHAALTDLALPEADLDADNDEVGTFSKEVALKKLGERLKKLESALAEVQREGREAEQTQAQKDRAIAAYDRTFSLSAGLLEVLLRFVGEGALADRVRPSTRRPGTTAQAETPDAPDLADPASPPSPADAGPLTPAAPGSPTT